VDLISRRVFIPIFNGVGGFSLFFLDEAGECFDGEFVEGGTVFVECIFLWDGEGVNVGLPGVTFLPPKWRGL
jgi:hypothetical protein